MPTVEDKRLGRVLVILTGGNIGLIATMDNRNETVLRPAELTELRALVLGSANADTLLLRERTLAGLAIHLAFKDLRQNDQRRFSDPEEFDSAQVDPRTWAVLADTIKDSYEQYEGFVILHGLDTMAYTASALSFMLQNLQSPVILTGSQRPLNYPRTDAIQNIYSALTLAAAESLGITPVVPEVAVYCYDTLFRGTRVSMMNASSYRTFDSPNFPPLATVGEHIETQAHLVKPRGSPKVLTVRNRVDAKVVILDVFPGMDAAIFENLHQTNSKGVLLRTYGMGTAPTSPSVLEALDALTLKQAKIGV
jgi:L-asparaginase/archaeal Glu-tRNAGln amidotransferase subunit D